VPVYPYPGPSVFGYETDRPLRRAAALCVHTSPIASLGSESAGGMNVYVRELACHLAEAGLPVDIFTRRSDPNTPETVEICPGVNVVSLTAGPAAPLDKNAIFPLLPEFAAQAALYSLRQGVRYDVVHAHYWLSGWAAHLLKRYWDAPSLLMFHTTAHMKNAVAATADRETPLRLEKERQLIDLVDGLIAANPDERADLIWRQHLPTDKICTVPPGVNPDRFCPADPGTRRSLRAELDLGDGDRAILFVGRIDPIKGLDTLLAAYRLLCKSPRPPVLFVVGGDLDPTGRPIASLAAVAAHAAELGVADSVRFLGARPQDELPSLYQAVDVVAIPSRYESFGLVAVEAMACGTPVVASRVGGLRFTVEEEVNGLLVPFGDPTPLARALGRVIESDALRQRLSDGALESVVRFAWPTVAAQILHVYERLAEGYRANLCCDEDLFA
jgi:D-inositol-3-phosphate glycosyltransferase